jgi:HAD superfamily hydrolase (TIGR01544 family)
VIADFDFTMTKFFNEKHQRSFSCHSLIESNQYVSEEYRKLAGGLLHYYYPIETSSSLSVEQKIPHMLEWVNRAHELMVERSGLRQSMIKLAVTEALEGKHIALRPGVPNFLAQLDRNEIPILIFSAGLSVSLAPPSSLLRRAWGCD